MKKVLLTGATGFVGSYIARQLLSKGYDLQATYRATSSFSLVEDIKDKVRWLEIDLSTKELDKEQVKGIDAIIHSAALISFDSREDMRRQAINVDVTKNLVDLAIDSEIKKFIYISSIAALGRPSNRDTIDESCYWDGLGNHYGYTKHLGEMEVRRGEAEGLNVSIVNPGLIIGAGHNKQGSSSLIQQIDRGMPFCTKGSTGVVDVRDIAHAVSELLEYEGFHTQFLLTGKNISYKELMSAIADAMDKNRPRYLLPAMSFGILHVIEKIRSIITNVPERFY